MAKVHFIGAGQMTEAIIRASLSNGTLRADAISLEDIDSARIEALHSRYRLSGDGGLSEASCWCWGSVRRTIWRRWRAACAPS